LKGQEGLESTKIAAYIHFLNYPDSRLQTVDLALIPGYLHKSFLFGTAQKNLPGFQYLDNGVIESLKKGVLILKNIHNLKWEVQNDLLLALKNNHILREDQKVLLKTKYIFINNMNIDKFVEKGLFRQDLFSVVAANTIHVPTLQQRKKDIPLVLENYHIWFQKRFNKNIEIPLEIKNHIINKSYPGQFEQFYSYLYSLFSLSENILTMDIIKCIDETALKSGKQGNSWETSSKIKKQTFEREPGFTDPSNFLFSNQAELVNIEYSLLDLEREYIKFILNKNFNNIAESSRILGITRKTLYDKLKKYNIHISIKSTG
jgi:DNA-binding NtrC family response regulator